MSQLRVAVVGAGPKGRQHVNVLHDFEDVDLVALCDPVDEVRDSVGDAFHVPNRYADRYAGVATRAGGSIGEPVAPAEPGA